MALSVARPCIHLSVLDAYRADLAGSDRVRLGSDDEQCLVFATLLHHAVTTPWNERTPYLERAFAPGSCPIDELAIAPPADILRSVAVTAYRLADYAERCGGFAVATTICDLAQGMLGDSEANAAGRLLYLQARVFRKIGYLDEAIDLLGRLDDLGRGSGDIELRALACLGQGVVARVRGNYPLARRKFSVALRLAPRTSRELDVALHANHGMLVASAVAGDFDSAIRHGGAALALAQAPEQRTEILVNMAAACFDAGEPRAALYGYLRALSETEDDRIRIACIGGAAVAAAQVGRVDIARRLLREGGTVVGRQGGVLAHETAELCRELFVAAKKIGDESSARRFRAEAEERAARHGFFEIAVRLDADEQLPAATPLTREAREIADSFAEADAEPLVMAVSRSGRLD